MMHPTAELAVDSRCLLGEGVLWCERRQALFWTDIESRRLWTHAPGGDARHWDLPDRLGCLALCDDGRLLLALAKGLYLFDPDAAGTTPPALRKLADIEPDRNDTRSNDGRCDRSGNFVFGTKSERADGAPVGAFYQFSLQHGLRRLDLPAAAIPNAICFSRDGGTLYFCDSAQPRILRCNYRSETAEVSAPEVFAEIAGPGVPDGAVIDVEGCLWNAQWGAARVVRYTPDGAVDQVLALPVNDPSCCAIGGPGLDTLYVTTARVDADAEALARTPAAGGLFRFRLPRALGLPESRFRTS